MKTLKDFKARFIVGAKLDAVNHKIPVATGRRTVTRVQGNGYWYTQDTSDAAPAGSLMTDRAGKRCFSNFPKASHLRIDGPDTASVLADWDAPGELTPLVTITFLGDVKT